MVQLYVKWIKNLNNVWGTPLHHHSYEPAIIGDSPRDPARLVQLFHCHGAVGMSSAGLADTSWSWITSCIDEMSQQSLQKKKAIFG